MTMDIQDKTNGGNKMAELTQWEYKYVSADLQEMSKAGEQGWEATGNSNVNGILCKRPKQPRQQKQSYQSDSYDYGYSR